MGEVSLMPQVTYIGLAVLLARGQKAAEDAVVKAAEHLVGEAQTAAPFKTGTLKGSIHAEDPVTSGTTVTAQVATGGESSEYAIFQHEGTSRGVPATKFLEAPLIGMAPVYRAYIERAMRSAY